MSTSSSNERLPVGPWGRTWVLAVVLAAAALTGWELYWRGLGFPPAGWDDTKAWVDARNRVRPTSTVFVGSSRIQTDLDPAEWQRLAGGEKPLQLALVGTTPIPVLEQVASDESFRGLAIVDIVPIIALETEFTAQREQNARRSLRAYEAQSPSYRSDLLLRRPLFARLVFRSPSLAPRELLDRARRGGLYAPPVFGMRWDRYLRIYPEALEEPDYGGIRRYGSPATGTALDSLIGRLQTSTTRIRERGGRVVFVLFPACGERRDVERERTPRAVYWNRITAIEGAEAIDAEDHDGLHRGFACTDGSHLQWSDALLFTRELVGLVVERPSGG